MHHDRVEFAPTTANPAQLTRPGIPQSWRKVAVQLRSPALIEPADLSKRRAPDSTDRTPRSAPANDISPEVDGAIGHCTQTGSTPYLSRCASTSDTFI